MTEDRAESSWWASFWQQLKAGTVVCEMHVQECEIHTLVHENHAQTRADHVAAHGGWNKVVKASTSSWDNGEDPSGARWSCRGTKVNRFGLEKTRVAHHRKIENGATTGGGKRPEGID